MKIPDYIQKAIKDETVHVLATSSKDGIPNIIYLTYLKIYNDEQILIGDNKFFKTKKNLEENPRIAFVVMDKENHKAYQLKGSVEIHKDDEIYKETVAWVNENSPHLTSRAGVILNIEEIYCGAEKIEE